MKNLKPSTITTMPILFLILAIGCQGLQHKQIPMHVDGPYKVTTWGTHQGEVMNRLHQMCTIAEGELKSHFVFWASDPTSASSSTLSAGPDTAPKETLLKQDFKANFSYNLDLNQNMWLLGLDIPFRGEELAWLHWKKRGPRYLKKFRFERPPEEWQHSPSVRRNLTTLMEGWASFLKLVESMRRQKMSGLRCATSGPISSPFVGKGHCSPHRNASRSWHWDLDHNQLQIQLGQVLVDLKHNKAAVLSRIQLRLLPDQNAPKGEEFSIEMNLKRCDI